MKGLKSVLVLAFLFTAFNAFCLELTKGADLDAAAFGTALNAAKSNAEQQNTNQSQDGYIKEISGASFEKEVLEYKGLVVVDFGGDWCVPCRQIKPFIENLAQKYLRNFVKVVSIDYKKGAAEKNIYKKYGINSVPGFAVFKNGQLKDVFEKGGTEKSAVIQKIENLIKSNL